MFCGQSEDGGCHSALNIGHLLQKRKDDSEGRGKSPRMELRVAENHSQRTELNPNQGILANGSVL